MGKDMVGIRVRKKVRRALKRIAWDEHSNVSAVVENILTDYVLGELSYPDDDDDEPQLPLSRRADKAAFQLQSIISEAEGLEIEADHNGHIDQAVSDLEALAEAIRDAGVEDDDDDQDDEDD